MPISATFTADFSQFVASTKNAEAALKRVEGGSAGAGRSLTVLQGGAGGAAGKVDKFALSVGALDTMLGRFGVNVPPAVRGVADLASHSVKAGGAVAKLGDAGLVASTAIGSYTLTRSLIDATIGTENLDSTVGNATAKLLGFGDVAGQKAAYSADVLGKASKTAGRAITDMAEAMRINEAEALRMIAANQKAGAAALQLADDDTKAAAIMMSNRQKLDKLERDFAVATAQHAAEMIGQRADTAAEWDAMQAESKAAHTKASADASATRQALRDNWIDLANANRAAGLPPPPGYPGFADGVTNFRGGMAWVGERGPELVNLPRGSSVTPAGRGGAPIIAQVYVSGVFDPASANTIGKVVKDHLGRAVLRGRG